MSKRHQHEASQDWHAHIIPADIPFREDLVFYAPLENPYCTHDYISGVAPITDVVDAGNYGYAVWDDNIGMYKCGFEQSDPNRTYFQASLRWMDLDLYPNGLSILNRGITIFLQTYQTRCKSNRYASWAMCDEFKTTFPNASGTGDNEANTTTYCNFRGMACKTGGGTQTSSALTTLSKCCVTYYPNKTIRWWVNGSPAPNQSSSTWSTNMITNPTTVSVMQAQRNMNYEENYVKDVRVYNRALSQTEVQQL